MLSSPLNLLVGIPYSWGKSDCWRLANYVREYFNASPLPSYDWVYEAYDEADLPPGLISQLLCEKLGPPTYQLDHLSLVVLNCRGDNLGTCVEIDGEKYIVYMGTHKSQMHPCGRVSKLIKGAWRPIP